MRPFSYTLKLDQPIDDNVSKAFTDILNELRKGMSGIAQEVRRHQERAEFFQKEVTNLRVANQRLTEENNRLRTCTWNTRLWLSKLWEPSFSPLLRST